MYRPLFSASHSAQFERLPRENAALMDWNHQVGRGGKGFGEIWATYGDVVNSHRTRQDDPPDYEEHDFGDIRHEKDSSSSHDRLITSQVYGLRALENKEGFTNAQSLLNIVENLMNILYLYLAHVSGSPVAPLLGFASVVMTLSKTVLYWAQEYYCGGCSVGHNDFMTLLVYWVIPNGYARLAIQQGRQSRWFSKGSLWQNDLPPASQRIDYQTKYAEKLQKKANEEGISTSELFERKREQEKARRREQLIAQAAKENQPSTPASTPSSGASSSAAPLRPPPVRKDNSPVKPLATLLNLDKLLQTPHTAEQISLLWTAYHGSRSGGTGRGFLCATIPVDIYEKMASIASRYPTFVIAVPRDGAQVGEKGAEDQKAYEFYFLQWDFHGSPAEPRPSNDLDDLFAKPKPSTNPQTSTILFTPLQEYKLRTSFATPYLVLTHYTDLAKSHGVVLLRGEITPSTGNSGTAGRYMLPQQDAQLLAVGAQKFYLWNDGSGQGEREALLKTFHENPKDFKWEDLLKHTEFSG
ncbi:hypothetical protein PHLCEN_2v1025 [Hermanssonia centrifuga]|uniref:Uncharacterized protein n=1 Tax=Hermanssonia centrifuga TaxID=98765 RepID=A0A2R6S4G1_9APHY|nr:hypothetical protein PHLCEN_2v1025 [Hermanssonia centrifuga]